MSQSVFNLNRYQTYYRRFEPLFKTSEAKAYTMVILSLFSITFFGLLAIRPTLKTIATLQRQISDKTFVNGQLDEKINALIMAQEEYQGISGDLPKLFALIPETAEFPLLLREVTVIAGENDATISGIAFDPIILYEQREATTAAVPEVAQQPEESSVASTQESVIPVTFTLTYQGEYQKLVDILTQLTKLDRLVTIETIDISQTSETGQSENVSLAELTIAIRSQAYYYPFTL